MLSLRSGAECQRCTHLIRGALLSTKLLLCYHNIAVSYADVFHKHYGTPGSVQHEREDVDKSGWRETWHSNPSSEGSPVADASKHVPRTQLRQRKRCVRSIETSTVNEKR